MAESALPGLARQLVAEGLVDQLQAEQAVAEARAQGLSLTRYMTEQELISSKALAKSSAELFGMPRLSLEALDPEQIPRDLVSEKLIRQHHCLPLFQRGKRLFIGVSDPTHPQIIEDIRFATGLSVESILVEEASLKEAIEALLDTKDQTLDALDDNELEGLDELEDLDVEAVDSAEAEEVVDTEEVDDAPVVRFVKKMLLTAVRMEASDLHFEPYEKIFRVRFRVDGLLQTMASPPVVQAQKIISRLKILASLDISERRRPQDGRIKMKLSRNRAVDFRVSSLPTLWGEKVVLRILDASNARRGIDALGYEDDQKALYLKALDQPQGMILVTGPTGSGKTVSLYTGLHILNTPERNISTAEDPVEMNFEGINQVSINSRQGLEFSDALRAFLRQDPDVIMLGEIRDLETANIAVKAAQTGHLVLSTLHTNSAAETLTRLLNMGVASFNLASSVSLIIAQRLARMLCLHCREQRTVPVDALVQQGMTPEQAASAEIYSPSPQGCDKCSQGYKGRVGLYEVVRVTPGLQKLIMEEANAIELAQLARQEGFRSLRQSGLLKVLSGATSLEEVNRVTME